MRLQTMPRHARPRLYQFDSQNCPSKGQMYLKYYASIKASTSLDIAKNQRIHCDKAVQVIRKRFKFYILRRLAKIGEYWTGNNWRGGRLLYGSNPVQYHKAAWRTGSSSLPSIRPKRIMRGLKAPRVSLLPAINATPAHRMTGCDTQSRNVSHNSNKRRPNEIPSSIPQIQRRRPATRKQKSVPLSFQPR